MHRVDFCGVGWMWLAVFREVEGVLPIRVIEDPSVEVRAKSLQDLEVDNRCGVQDTLGELHQPECRDLRYLVHDKGAETVVLEEVQEIAGKPWIHERNLGRNEIARSYWSWVPITAESSSVILAC